MVGRIVLVIVASTGVVLADPPSGYRCGAGKPDVGKGCTCPVGKRSSREASGVATCVAAPTTVNPEVTPACRKDPSACSEVPTDAPGAESNFRSGCDRDDPDSCWRLSAYLKDPEAEAKMLEHSCLLGAEYVCRNLGETLATDDKQLRAARARFDAACARDRCAGLAVLYEQGLGVAKDLSKAADYHMRGCKRRVRSCLEAAQLYEYTKEDAKLFPAVERLCKADPDSRYAQGCRWLAELIRGGRGTKKDPAKAFALFEKECGPDGDGLLTACMPLGEMLVAGEGTAVDVARARRLYERHCRSNNLDAVGRVECEHLAKVLAELKPAP
jgi:hypothetical protein